MALKTCHISVADTGPGILPEETNKIFAKFYQVANIDKQKPKGSGWVWLFRKRLWKCTAAKSGWKVK